MKKEEIITCCLNALDLFEVIPNFKQNKKFSRVVKETKEVLLEVKKAIKNNISNKKIIKYLKEYIKFVENTYENTERNMYYTHFVFRIERLIYSIIKVLNGKV